ncbi:hypothetical protein [Chryseosolibacter indicus]|uniref:Lipoprotein n=1 Tax=Chryseosolibacter indicus TaxID=2782351 RepID=A0ABS5VLN7_9BACT|nr:hypothetical protein [Chryseosolibacter indicus]MBT1701644.1 hypothetical protein [Chryseosolibacter indicus]
MNSKSYFKRLFFISALFVSLISCREEEERLTLQDSQTISEESLVDSYFQDVDDIAQIVIDAPTQQQLGEGRSATSISIHDNRFLCSGVAVTLTQDASSTPEIPKGNITVDFGANGCIDNRGNVRKGKLIFAYHGRRFAPGSTVITTTSNYSINDVKLEGVRTLTNIQSSTETAPSFRAVLSGGKATFTDGSLAERTSDITWTWVRGANRVDDYLLVDQSSKAEGKARSGKPYSVALLSPLKYKRFCGIAVEGEKQITVDRDKKVSIDYGDGSCDRMIVLTINGDSREVVVN